MFTIPTLTSPSFPGYTDPGYEDEDSPITGDPGTISASDAQQIALLYEAALNRPADKSGLNFWIDQFEGGRSALNISQFFVNSPEFNTAFGNQARMSNAQLVDVFYKNVLDRSGEADGMEFWVGKLEDGMPREEVLFHFSISAENREGSTYITGLHNNGAGDWWF